MTVAEYKSRLMTLERFTLGNFEVKRERAKKFMVGHRLSIQSVVLSFTCAMLAKAVMRALEVDNLMRDNHMVRSGMSYKPILHYF